MAEISKEHREAARLLLNKLDGHHSVKEELTIAAEFIANLEARVRQEEREKTFKDAINIVNRPRLTSKVDFIQALEAAAKQEQGE